MWPKLVPLVLVLSCISVFGQKKFTTLRDLRQEWSVYEEGGYVPVAKVPVRGLNTIYVRLDGDIAGGAYLRVASERPYFIFLNGKVRGEYSGTVRLDIDSLARMTGSPSLIVAIHQKNISERDLRTEIVSLRAASTGDVAMADRPYSHFRDFVVVAGLVIILLFLLLLRLQPKLASDYFSVTGVLSSRDADDGQVMSRLTSGSNVQFYVLCSLLLGFYLLIVFYNLPSGYALPARFAASAFWTIWLQWLKLSLMIFGILLLKIVIIYSLTRLFGLYGTARFHFFNWVRLLLVVFGGLTIVLFMYFISRGDRSDIFVFFLSLVIVTLVAWIVVAFLKLGGRTGHSMFHLFSYLCATEIIPLLITVKVLFQ